MKKVLSMIVLLWIGLMMIHAGQRVVVLDSNISCQNCVNNIKEKIRFEKGVKKIEADLETKTITITYDEKKNSAEALSDAVTKIGYKSSVKSDYAVEKKEK